MSEITTSVTERQLDEMVEVGWGRNDVDPVIYRLFYDPEIKQHYTAHQYGVMTDEGPQYETKIIPVKSTPSVGVSITNAYERLKSFGTDIQYRDVEVMAKYHDEYVRDTFSYHLYDEHQLVIHGNDIGLELDDPYHDYLNSAPVEFDNVEDYEVFHAFSPVKDFAPNCEFYGKLRPVSNSSPRQ